MESELKRSHDSEIATTAPNGPEKIRVFGRARAHQFSSGGHDIGRQQVVDGQPVLPADPAETATERQPGDACRGVDPNRSRKTKGLSLLVEIGQSGSRLHTHRSPFRIDTHRDHPRQVKHQTAVTYGVSR